MLCSQICGGVRLEKPRAKDRKEADALGIVIRMLGPVSWGWVRVVLYVCICVLGTECGVRSSVQRLLGREGVVSGRGVGDLGRRRRLLRVDRKDRWICAEGNGKEG
jgi:hypothetical protein